MTSSNQQLELRELLELYCENQISQQQLARLEQLAAADDESMQFYMDYIELHGNLMWDLAAHQAEAATTKAVVEPIKAASVGSRSSRIAIIGALTACLAIAAVAIAFRSQPENVGPNVATNETDVSGEPVEQKPLRNVKPLELSPSVAQNEIDNEENPASIERRPVTNSPQSLTDAEVIAGINREIEKGWKDSGVQPSGSIDDPAWLRRVSLNVLGRIPRGNEVSDLRSGFDRSAIVASLLDEPSYARYWSSQWTNLLIGRSSERGVNRPGFEKFLRDRFASNLPWNETVAELIAAEGTTEENGATNFLVTHLNSQAVPATAVTARVFLGIQVQCTQCHDHPFNDSWKQDQFWSLNSFFKQTKRERKFSGQIGPQYLLTSTNKGGPTFYETRSGLMQSAMPKYGDREVDAGPETNRRAELARIITHEDSQQLAKAMVNRVWAHFFGHGFTTPIDDMGPHNLPSHPELLELLADQFRLSGFDLNRLISWIVLSKPYELDSSFTSDEQSTMDAPTRGDVPLFSRMYVRSMSPEQVYDSLLIATKADQRPGFDWNNATANRHEWIQQFMFAHRNEENTESSTFDGTVTQALSLMNSELVSEAVSTERGTLLASVIGERKKPAEQLIAICQAVLSREPSDKELDAFRKLMRRERSEAARTALLQDVLWAYLNSNEFILIH